MKRAQIENILQSLAMSQGFYGRLLNDLYNASEDQQDEFWAMMEAQNFGDSLDVVLFLES